MSMSTFVALCLLALPPSDCPGGCYPQHHLPFLGRHVLPSLDGQFDWSGDYGGLMAGEWSVVPPLPEPASPVVLLRSLEVGVADQQSFLASSDRPAYWTAVPFAPLSVEVQVPIAAAEIAPTEPLEYVVLLLDGKPVENNRYLTGAQPAPVPSADGQLRMAYIFNFPCPAPGKHIVQARYKMAGLWSRISEPLHFDVRLPDPPRIVAISDVNGVPAPVRKAGLISITKPEVIVRLANVSQNASVVAYLDGKPISTTLAQESCCRTLRLQGHITPGIHSLRLRTVTSGGSCSVTSDPSDEVVFHYYDEDVYLLRPRNRCKNCPPTANVHAHDILVTTRGSLAATPSQAAGRSLAMSAIRQPSVQLAVVATEVLDHPLRPAVFVKSQSDWSAAFRFVSYAADSPADEALKAEKDAQGFASVAASALNQARGDAIATRDHASSAAAAATTAAQARAAADTAGSRTQAEADRADKALKDAEPSMGSEAKQTRAAANAARKLAEAALRDADAAVKEALSMSLEVSEKALAAKSESEAADKLTKDVEDAVGRAADAVRQAKGYAGEAVQAFNANNLGMARDRRDRALETASHAQAAANEAVEKAAAVARAANLAAGFRKQAEVALLATQTQASKADSAAQKAKQGAAKALALADAAAKLQATINAAVTRTSDNAAAAEAALVRASAAAGDAAEQAAVADAAAWQATKDAEAAEAETQQTGALVRSAQMARTAAIHGAAEAAEKAHQARLSKEKEANAARRTRAESHQVQAEANRDSAIRQQELAGVSHDRAAQEGRNADVASRNASAHAKTASQDATRSRTYAKKVADVAREVEAAVQEAHAALTQTQQAAGRDDLAEVQAGEHQSLRALQQAVGRSGATSTDQRSAKTASEAAAAQAASADVQRKAATAARERAAAETDHAKAAAQNAEGHALAAAHHAAEARRFQVADEAIAERRNVAELERAVRALQSAGTDIEVQRATDATEFAQGLATKEWAQADARINLADANDSITRAQAVQGPPSPFYFASTAHFPIREFGVQGEALDRDGAVIYEDMAFSFDREGNYNVRFTIGTPAVPTTIQLRFLIQPCPGGPWYTVTLEPIGFPPTKVPDGKYTPSVFRNHVVEGKSEILRRCYGEMGQDATIRREGTARFGFGLAGLSQNKAG